MSPFKQGLAGLLFCVGATVHAGDREPLPALSDQQTSPEPGVVLSGLLRPEALAAWDPSSTIVVDLRTPEEGVAEEAGRVHDLGMTYVNISVAGATLREEQISELGAVLAARGASTVVVHCASGNRAGMLWGAYRLSEGDSLDSVLERAGAVLTKAPARDALQDYARSNPSN